MNCQVCGQEMVVIKWNSAGNIAYCNNIHCTHWHQPYAAGDAQITPVKTLARKEPNPTSHKYHRTRKERLNEAPSKLE
jgi:hypothetical protein